jgi:hypothetical protein
VIVEIAGELFGIHGSGWDGSATMANSGHWRAIVTTKKPRDPKIARLELNWLD